MVPQSSTIWLLPQHPLQLLWPRSTRTPPFLLINRIGNLRFLVYLPAALDFRACPFLRKSSLAVIARLLQVVPSSLALYPVSSGEGAYSVHSLHFHVPLRIPFFSLTFSTLIILSWWPQVHSWIEIQTFKINSSGPNPSFGCKPLYPTAYWMLLLDAPQELHTQQVPTMHGAWATWLFCDTCLD